MKTSKKSTPVRRRTSSWKSWNLAVFSNLAISLDGKIATRGREFFALGSKHDLLLLRKLRNAADAVVFGAGVLRTFRRACLPLDRRRRIVNAVLTRKLEGIDPRWPFFRDPAIGRILYVTEAISAETRRKFSDSSEIVRISSADPARAILRDLDRRGFSRVGVEGGGDLMWSFVAADAIDEVYLTLTPRIVGGRDAPTLVDGVGFDPKGIRTLRLKSLRRVGDELYLVYARKKARGKS